MLVLLTASLVLATAQDTRAKAPVRSDEVAAYEFALRPGSPDGGGVLLTLFIKPLADQGYAIAQADYLMDCPGRTATMQAARTYDAAGKETRSVEAPRDRQRAEPVYSGDAIGDLYALVCPDSPPLSSRPPPGPPPVLVPVPPRP